MEETIKAEPLVLTKEELTPALQALLAAQDISLPLLEENKSE